MDNKNEYEDISSSSKDHKERLFFTPDNTDSNDADFIFPNDDGIDISSSSDRASKNRSVSQSNSEAVSLSSYSTKGRAKKRGKKSNRKKVWIPNTIIGIVLVISLFSTGILWFLGSITSGAKFNAELSENESDLGITEQASSKLPKGIINIALFGVDSRNKVTDNKSKAIAGLSDSIIILSVNTIDNTVKLTSILRDSFVPVEGHGNRKITDAYSYGGAQLAIKTLNQNFGLNIKDYVTVSLYQLWKVIDYMGGIDINLTEKERIHLNGLIDGEHFEVEHVKESGYVHLSGGQAMNYARIRKIDGDDVRALRQQKVLTCLFEKAKKIPVSQYASLLKKILNDVETSLSFDEIMEFAPILSSGKLKMQTSTIPGDTVVARGGIFTIEKDGIDSHKGWVWVYNLTDAKKYIYKWIYGIEYDSSITE